MINQRDISDTKFIMKQFSKQLQPNKLLVNIKKQKEKDSYSQQFGEN